MNDMPATKKQSVLLPAVGVAALAASIGIVLFSGASSITEENIRQRLQSFADRVSQEAVQSGKESRFSYDSLSIDGWGYNKHGVVGNVSLAFSEKSLLDTNRWAFSTVRMLVLPNPTAPSDLYFVFPEPINIIENSQLKSTVTFPSPPRYSYFDGKEKGQHIVAHSLQLPGAMYFTPPKTADEAADRAHHVTVTFDDKPLIRVRSNVDAGESEAEYAFRNVLAHDDAGSRIAAAAVDSHYTAKSGEQHALSGKYTLSILDVAVTTPTAASKPYGISADIDFSGTLADRHVTVNQLQLAGADFKISVKGEVAFSEDDQLPSGDMTFSITNVPQLLSSELVSESMRAPVASALEKITGRPEAQLKDIDIPLKRAKNGVFYIGNTTFEQLTLSVVSGFLPTAPQAPAVLPPDSDGNAESAKSAPGGEDVPAGLSAPETDEGEPAPFASPSPSATPEEKKGQ